MGKEFIRSHDVQALPVDLRTITHVEGEHSSQPDDFHTKQVDHITKMKLLYLLAANGIYIDAIPARPFLRSATS